MPNDIADWTLQLSGVASGEFTAGDFKYTGLAPLLAGRVVGNVNGGPPPLTPSSGSWQTGDIAPDHRWGVVWVWNGTLWMPAGGPGPYTARLYRLNALSLGSGGVVIPFDTINYDPSGNAATGANAGWTTPLNGRYRVTVRASQSNTASGALRLYAYVIAGGVEVARGVDNTASNVIFGCEVTATVQIAANTLVQGGFFISAGPVSVESGSTLCYMDVQYESMQ